ncbi:MAG: class A beta-lactamase-related serine hydrolase [Chloroflexi bacterium]|nr:class A beta-lactamase-related serine hydrolase [Chloroflexota bacterium]
MAASSQQLQELHHHILRLIATAPARYAAVLWPLEAPEPWLCLNDDIAFYAASLVKIPIMAVAFELHARGQLSLEERLTVKQSDIVSGSGVLKLLQPDISLPLWDLLRLMICVSDNTATNILIQHLQDSTINEILEEWNFGVIRVHHLLQIGRVDSTQRNLVTAGEISKLLVHIAKGTIVSRWACEQMLVILKQQQYNDEIPALLPTSSPDIIGAIPPVVIAHKTGWIPGTRHDAAIIYTPTMAYVFCLSADHIENEAATRSAMQHISRAVYDVLVGARQ